MHTTIWDIRRDRPKWSKTISTPTFERCFLFLSDHFSHMEYANNYTPLCPLAWASRYLTKHFKDTQGLRFRQALGMAVVYLFQRNGYLKAGETHAGFAGTPFRGGTNFVRAEEPPRFKPSSGVI